MENKPTIKILKTENNNASQESSIAPKTSEATTQAGNILLVEDNEFNREVVVMLLQEVGIEADIAINGKVALTLLNENPNRYQLILMDCQMPEMDGYEASERIRQGESGAHYQNTPIIALTANAMKGDKEKCLAAGMTDYLTKPIDGELLIAKIKAWQGQVHREDAMN